MNHCADIIPKADKLLVLRDFNARVGSDYKTWDRALGYFGKENANFNGELIFLIIR